MRQRWLALLSSIAVVAGVSWSAVMFSVVVWAQVFYPESIRGPGIYAFMGSGPFLMMLLGLAVLGGGAVAAAGFVLKFTVSEVWRWRRLRREIIAVLVVVAAFVLPRFVLLPPPAPTARNDAEQDFARYAADQTWDRLATFYQDRLGLTRDATDLLLMIWVTGWRVAEIEPIKGVCGVHDRGWDVGSYRGIVRFYGPFGILWYSVSFACPAESGTVHPGSCVTDCDRTMARDDPLLPAAEGAPNDAQPARRLHLVAGLAADGLHGHGARGGHRLAI